MFDKGIRGLSLKLCLHSKRDSFSACKFICGAGGKGGFLKPTWYTLGEWLIQISASETFMYMWVT